MDDDTISPYIDCSSLTECKWDGIHEKFLGDGICNEDYEGCYNTAVCGYDGTCHCFFYSDKLSMPDFVLPTAGSVAKRWQLL